MKSFVSISIVPLACGLALLLLSAGCGPKVTHGEPAYVAGQQVDLRDHLSAVYNRVDTVTNGERVEILEKNRRFVRVRSPRGKEGWMEASQLVGADIGGAFATLEKENQNTPIITHGVTQDELNMHVTPGRETLHLYRLAEGAKLEILKRATAPKPQPQMLPTAATTANGKPAEPPAPVLEDWWLVRDAQQHTGWVLARMVDINAPMDIAQYAEGQRIMAAFVLDQVPDVGEDGTTRQVPQYLTLVNDPKEGTPWDFDQIRVFTWNAKRHRYETAYRERDLFGVFPATVGMENFGEEGNLPTFVIRVKDDNGNITENKYKLNQPLVQRVLSPEEQKAEDARHAVLLQQALARRAARGAAAGPRRRRR